MKLLSFNGQNFDFWALDKLASVVDVIKLFFGGNLDFPKIKKLNKVCSMSEPAQKCENYAIFKQNYTLQLFIALKMVYCCSLGLRGNLDFPDFLQNKFYNINYWLDKSLLKCY